jgi:TrmH family RNA methyltransferase
MVRKARRLARARKREPTILLEGLKLIEAALDAGVEIESLLVSSALPRDARARFGGLEPSVVSARLFPSLSSLEAPEGALAFATRPSRPLQELTSRGLAAVAVGIQDPGNLGAIARVAEAAGAAALVAVKGTADPFGPKALRGSMGSLLRLPVFEVDGPGALRDIGFRLAALVPRGGTDFRDVDWSPPLAVLFGSESRGLSDDTVALAELRVTIPMKGRVESLNVATAAALVLYEAARRPG